MDKESSGAQSLRIIYGGRASLKRKKERMCRCRGTHRGWKDVGGKNEKSNDALVVQVGVGDGGKFFGTGLRDIFKEGALVTTARWLSSLSILASSAPRAYDPTGRAKMLSNALRWPWILAAEMTFLAAKRGFVYTRCQALSNAPAICHINKRRGRSRHEPSWDAQRPRSESQPWRPHRQSLECATIKAPGQSLPIRPSQIKQMDQRVSFRVRFRTLSRKKHVQSVQI